MKLQLMFETNKDCSCYVPALKLGVVGFDIDDARETIKDLIELELANGAAIETYSFDKIQVDGKSYTCLIEQSSETGRYSCYLPGLRLSASGSTQGESKIAAADLLLKHKEEPFADEIHLEMLTVAHKVAI
ncbi:hypothetical protein ACE41H_15260 [Paenibacillus enshidis]|uniref:Uncharacterized protein n=1 Tax=Paenibacillus enshidis TaxID=1458439 RepID=A0ABV5AV83_9BACL